MSKSAGHATTPMHVLERFGSDGVRWRAASARPGTDTPFDEAQMKVGRRLATKILNVGRLIDGLAGAGDVVTAPLDLAMHATLAGVVREATEAFDRYDYTTALESTERFFWSFCDDYVELVKDRAYAGPDAGRASARVALALALDVQLRLFAPIMPFVTEEVWSRRHDGSIHRASWPEPDELPGGGDPDVLTIASAVLARLRAAKSDRGLSMRAELGPVEVSGTATDMERLALARTDVAAAGKLADLTIIADRDAADLTVTVP